MTDAQPGPAESHPQPRCLSSPDGEDPVCADLRPVLHCPSTSFVDYDFYFCPDCRRIWERSYFYQDWEPHWSVISFDELQANRKHWVGNSGKDHFPEALFAQGWEGFVAWIMAGNGPILSGSLG